MREIKFRAWIKKETRMAHVDVLSQDGKSITVYDSDNDGTYNRHIGSNKFELMQYTGLKDKNGKEIYEEDIIMHHKYGGNHVVKWLNDSAGFFIDGIYPQVSVMGLSRLCEKNIEIIGNIYENPDLLEGL